MSHASNDTTSDPSDDVEFEQCLEYEFAGNPASLNPYKVVYCFSFIFAHFLSFPYFSIFWHRCSDIELVHVMTQEMLGNQNSRREHKSAAAIYWDPFNSTYCVVKGRNINFRDRTLNKLKLNPILYSRCNLHSKQLLYNKSIVPQCRYWTGLSHYEFKRLHKLEHKQTFMINFKLKRYNKVGALRHPKVLLKIAKQQLHDSQRKSLIIANLEEQLDEECKKSEVSTHSILSVIAKK